MTSGRTGCALSRAGVEGIAGRINSVTGASRVVGSPGALVRIQRLHLMPVDWTSSTSLRSAVQEDIPDVGELKGEGAGIGLCVCLEESARG